MRHVLEAILAQVTEANPVGEVTFNHVGSGLRKQNLSTMSGLRDPRGAMDPYAHIPAFRGDGHRRMEPHPHAQSCTCGPSVGLQCLLSGQCRPDSILCRVESNKETVPLSVDLLTGARRDRSPQDLPVLSEDLGVPTVAELTQ